MTGDQFVIIVAIAGVVSVVKNVAGFGYPLLLLPILAQFIDVVDAVLIIAPSNLFLNVGLCWKLRELHAQATTLNTFVTAGAVGVVGGTLLLPLIPAQVFRLILFLVLIVFLINRLSGVKFTLADSTAHRWAPVAGGFSGLFQGAVGVSGPLVTPWFLSVDLERDTFVYSVSFFFGVTGVGQIAVASLSQHYTSETLLIGLALIPLSAVSLPVGDAIRDRISVSAFERVVIGLLVIAAITLLIRIL